MFGYRTVGSKGPAGCVDRGKNREIRRVFSHFHLHPRRLHRIRIGPVRLGTLEEGKSRPLTEREMELLPREPSNKKEPPMVIAIDGPAGSGKSTIARLLAERLGFTYVNSGNIYRAITLGCLRSGINPTDSVPATEYANRADISYTNGQVYLLGKRWRICYIATKSIGTWPPFRPSFRSDTGLTILSTVFPGGWISWWREGILRRGVSPGGIPFLFGRFRPIPGKKKVFAGCFQAFSGGNNRRNSSTGTKLTKIKPKEA